MRGKNGGFVLSRHPSKITLGDILYTVEGDMALIDCVSEPQVCNRYPECMSRATWLELSDLINDYLKNTTLEDVLKKGIFSQLPDDGAE
jgi:Rrf2 family protein